MTTNSFSFEITDSNNNNKKMFVFDVFEIANLIDIRFGRLLKNPEINIYVKNKTEPLLKNDRNYFYKLRNDPNIYRMLALPSPEELGSVEEIYAHDLTLLFQSKAKDNGLSNLPNGPVIAVKLIIELLRYSIDTKAKWMPYENIKISKKSLQHLWSEYLNKDVTDALSDDELNTVLSTIKDLCDPYVAMFEQFYDGNPWQMYSIKLNNYNAVIEQLGDYRIFDWHRQQINKNEVADIEIFSTVAATINKNESYF